MDMYKIYRNKILCIRLWKRFVAGILAAVFSATVVAVNAAWDGYVETGEGADVISLMNFASAANIMASGGFPDQTYTKNGNTYSIGWLDMNQTKNIKFTDVPKDWTPYANLILWIYSDGAQGDSIMLAAYSENNANNELRYFRYQIDIDWEGWKELSIPINKMRQTRGPSWDNIIKFYLSSSGWEMNPNGCTGKLYVADAFLKKSDGVSLELLYGEEMIRAAIDAIHGGAAVYDGSPNVVVGNGEVKKLEPEDENICAYQIADTVMTPLSFFKNYMGAEVEEIENSYKVKLGELEISGTINETAYTIGGESGEFTEAAQVLNGKIYLPMTDVAEAFGWFSVSDRGMAAVSPNKDIKVLEHTIGVNELSEIISYLAGHITIDVNSLTDEDFTAVKDKWRHDLIGSAADNDMSNPYIAQKIQSINSTGNNTWKGMIKEDGQTELFEGIVTTASAHMTETYKRLYQMTLAYGTPGTQLYHNEELKNDILFGIDWLYKNRYGEAEKNGTGWRKTTEYNWWDWKIGVPQYLVQILLILEDEFTEQQFADYLSLFDTLVPMPFDEGSNMLHTAKYAIGSALLQKDARKIMSIQCAVEACYLFVDNGRNMREYPRDQSKSKGQGFYTDGSYVFHMLHSMNGTYGREQFNLIGPFISLFSGTALEITTPQKNNLADWLYDSYDPLVYQGSIFRMVMGRYPGNLRSYGMRVVGGMLDTLDSLSEKDRAAVKAIIKSRVQEDIGDSYYDVLSLSQTIKLVDVLNDNTVEAREPLLRNHVYYNMDKVVHQRGNFALGLSMSSSRIFNYESANQCNQTGWYSSDGMTEYRVESAPEQADGKYWDYINPYRLPGTTVDTQERKAVSINNNNAYLSSKDFVGAVSLDETYGTAAMWLESYHNEKDFGEDGGDAGGVAPAHDCNLTAKKAYFMFDDEVVCLGADINASNNAEVLTIVDNKLANKTVTHGEQVASEPYTVVSVSASDTPQEANIAENTLDSDYETKWAAASGATITWDLGEEKELGFITLAFMYGAKRTQQFTIETSVDGKKWQNVFSGSSCGVTEREEAFTLGNTTGRYVRFKNLGNSINAWVSLTEAEIYPPNADGSVYVMQADILGADRFVADGSVKKLTDEDTDLTGTSWAHYENIGGYYFPVGGNLFARYTKQENSFMELWFSHGVNPENGTYAYTLLPSKSEEETREYAQNPDIEILVNLPELQVVRDKKLNATGMVFWEAGSYGDISVDKPMIVMAQEKDDMLAISACDPTQKLQEAEITINRDLKVVSSDAMMTVKDGASPVKIHMNLENSNGRSMEASFEFY